MAEPKRGWATRDIDVHGLSVREDGDVWILERGADWVDVESRGRRARVPAAAVSESPFVGPALSQLNALDPCFGLADDAFAREYLDQAQYFEIRRCKAHGRRFLWTLDAQWCQRLTLLLEQDGVDPKELWEHYFHRSDRWHAPEGRTLFG